VTNVSYAIDKHRKVCYNITIDKDL